MKMPILLFFLTGFILLSCSSNKKLVKSQPSSTRIKNSYVKEITVDGNDADWQGITLSISPANSFEYSVAHNDQNIFVMMKITNPVEQMKFLKEGMELRIDPTGQEKQKAEIVYPVKGELAENAMQPQNNSLDKKENLKMMHLDIRAQLVSMNRIGFKPEYSGVQTISQNTGFKGAINWNEANELIYELKIPLQAFNETVSKDNFDLAFSIGALERTIPSQENSSGSSSRRGNGMRGGGGYRGGQGRYGGSERRSQDSGEGTDKIDWEKMRDKESFWVECTL
jgi:uncharacterized membrane protein YgcG